MNDRNDRIHPEGNSVISVTDFSHIHSLQSDEGGLKPGGTLPWHEKRADAATLSETGTSLLPPFLPVIRALHQGKQILLAACIGGRNYELTGYVCRVAAGVWCGVNLARPLLPDRLENLSPVSVTALQVEVADEPTARARRLQWEFEPLIIEARSNRWPERQEIFPAKGPSIFNPQAACLLAAIQLDEIVADRRDGAALDDIERVLCAVRSWWMTGFYQQYLAAKRREEFGTALRC
jgi:hypothetical protein